MRHRANALTFPLADTGLQCQVAAVVSMVPCLIATDGSTPHKPFNAFLKEVVGPCWLFSSFVVKHKHVQSCYVAGGGWLVLVWFRFFFAYF